MFIEKIKKEDIEKFAHNYDCTVSKFDKNDGYYYVSLFTGAYGPQPQIVLSDFACKTDKYHAFSEDRLDKDWKKFLFEKFGEEYKTELKKHLMNQVDELSK